MTRDGASPGRGSRMANAATLSLAACASSKTSGAQRCAAKRRVGGRKQHCKCQRLVGKLYLHRFGLAAPPGKTRTDMNNMRMKSRARLSEVACGHVRTLFGAPE